ncbi:MAG: MotA/TolQ/ExbB proton channel family protein [Pseudomonadales bacterium]|jgi:biopolymer transport protein ExbB|nr:MotA/TolQ/ExbB proton channel family protein [Pseudomonadales bacterium]MDP4639523.1 MotA/TolQ/ExbB proton channel family protein [Pseudomonadales bacterium]MDP4764896.1 MotA/TolQ/ExbB proton channel family protein [Pseudomonadales bacterium]MDP4876312.1 MotA/TolQ/ExbB proton channel family protein [Pseudomonadales bacterium]MDP4912139.1 MotA/TolQ/ExbB proton channel family protein [Pseudomonadales bacterium]
MKKISLAFLTLALTFSLSVQAEDSTQAKSLGELLQTVKDGKFANQQLNQKREREFLADKAKQQKALEDARRTQREEEARSERLENKFETNEQTLIGLNEALSKRLGSLRELFGVLQQVAGDTQGVFEGSIVSAEYPGRGQWLGEFAQSMGKSTKLASIEEIERLWFELQREMTESAKVTTFTAKVNKLDGEVVEQEIIRIGTFNLVSNGQYVTYDMENEIVKELGRQPAGRFVDSTVQLSQATSGFVPFGMDPTRGQLLAMQVQVPTLEERVHQGGTPGYVIVALGIIALLLSAERFTTLSLVGARVRAQMKSATANLNNPLGRVLAVYHENLGIDAETLQLKLDEAILKEQPALQARISFIKIISMVAPLLGLLGTVIGMIVTFQAITLFGTGDPKTMAGGISQALVTTVLGLVVAIPTVLLHSIVHSRSAGVMHILTEQSAGLIAEHAEKAGK